MKFLFDTDHISILQRRSGSAFAVLATHLAIHPPADIAFSIASFHEQLIGGHSFLVRAKTMAETVRGYQMLEQIRRDFTIATVLPFDAAAAAIFDRLHAARIRVATMDLRIASIALANNLVLVTSNKRDFSKVPALTIEDWTI